MWIELPDEVGEYLDCINNPMCKTAIAVNALLDSMLKGQHIVYATRSMLDKLKKLEYISPSNKSFICWIKQQYIYLYGCRDIIEYKIKVSTEIDTISVIDGTYIVPLDYFFDFRESKLLTENETDGEFFKRIYKFIEKNKKVGDFYDVKFENDSGHGANVGSKIMQTAKENRIAICILDSDRDMKGAARGSTFKGANKSYKKVKNTHIMLLETLESREKENLFPPSAYMLICEEKIEFLSILNQFISEERIIKYFDIKDGVKYSKYKINGWEHYYKDVLDALIGAGLYKMPQPSEEGDDFVCIAGIGEKICDILCQLLLGTDQISEQVMERQGFSEDKKNAVRQMRKIVENVLPQYLYAEWEQIHNLLFSWGCCISPKKLPIYQI